MIINYKDDYLGLDEDHLKKPKVSFSSKQTVKSQKRIAKRFRVLQREGSKER